MPSNLQVGLSAVITLIDNLLSPTPIIVTRQLNNPSYPSPTVFYDPYFQTVNGTATVNLPAATVHVVYVRNLSNAGNITVNFTPTGGGAQTLLLVAGAAAGAGDLFLYFQLSAGAGGITALSLTAGAILPVEVFVAA